jgi:hypothetical protein
MNFSAITTPITIKVANVTTAINQSAAEPVFANISWKGFVILMAIIIITAIIGLILAISDSTRKFNNPLIKAFFLTMFFTLFICIAEGVFYPDKGVPAWLRTCIVISYFLSLLILFLTHKSTLEKKLESFKQRIPGIVFKEYSIQLNASDIKTPPISNFVMQKSEELYGTKDDNIVHYLIKTNANEDIYLVFGLESEAVVKLEYDPDALTMKEIFHKVPQPKPELFPYKMPPMPAPQSPPQNAQTS